MIIGHSQQNEESLYQKYKSRPSGSHFRVKLHAIRLKITQLLHESFVRLRLLPLCFTEFKGVIHSDTKAPHYIHYEGCSASRLAHGAVH